MKISCKRLPFANVLNIRDLGGYAVENGHVTSFGKLIRSSSTSKMDVYETDYLHDIGIGTAIDLRTYNEIQNAPSKLSNFIWIDYHNIPLAPDNPSGVFVIDTGYEINHKINWANKYIEIAENCKNWIYQCVIAISKSEKPVIFFCSSGKDRTGIISAMLLGLVGANNLDIIADYCVSQIYLAEDFNMLLPKDLVLDERNKLLEESLFFKTTPKTMSVFLEYLESNYGNIKNYLYSCGVEDDASSRLRNLFLL